MVGSDPDLARSSRSTQTTGAIWARKAVDAGSLPLEEKANLEIFRAQLEDRIAGYAFGEQFLGANDSLTLAQTGSGNFSSALQVGKHSVTLSQKRAPYH